MIYELYFWGFVVTSINIDFTHENQWEVGEDFKQELE